MLSLVESGVPRSPCSLLALTPGAFVDSLETTVTARGDTGGPYPLAVPTHHDGSRARALIGLLCYTREHGGLGGAPLVLNAVRF